MPGAQADHGDPGSADDLLRKLRTFAAGLDAAERQMLAALLAPGIEAAWQEDPEVAGFGVDWTPHRLPDHLVTAIQAHRLRIEGW